MVALNLAVLVMSSSQASTALTDQTAAKMRQLDALGAFGRLDSRFLDNEKFVDAGEYPAAPSWGRWVRHGLFNMVVNPASGEVVHVSCSYGLDEHPRLNLGLEAKKALAEKIFRLFGYTDEKIGWPETKIDAKSDLLGTRYFHGVPYDTTHHGIEVGFDYADRLELFRVRPAPKPPREIRSPDSKALEKATDLICSTALEKLPGTLVEVKASELTIVSPDLPYMGKASIDTRTPAELELGRQKQGIYTYRTLLHVIDDRGNRVGAWGAWTDYSGRRVLFAKYVSANSRNSGIPADKKLVFVPERVRSGGLTLTVKKASTTRRLGENGLRVLVRSGDFTASGTLSGKHLTVHLGFEKHTWLVEFK